MLDNSARTNALAIRFFDPFAASTDDWSRLHAYRRLRQEEDNPGELVLPDADFETELRAERPLYEHQRHLAWRDGRIVGNLILSFRRAGSPGHADFAPFVDAAGGVPRVLRRQGIARALLGTLHGFMQERGMHTATMRVHVPDGHAAMAAIGAACNYRSVENRLPLTSLDWDMLARWRARADARAQELTWEIHAGRVPLQRLATLMAPFSTLINEQPLGTLEVPRLRYELPGYVTWYADMDRRGGEHFLVLLCRGEELVAMCDASWDARFPDRIYQQLTAVAAPWRGQGLAQAVKAAMLQLVRKRHPEARFMVTTNAQANVPMLSINQRLGFAAHREDGTYQIERAALARFAPPRG